MKVTSIHKRRYYELDKIGFIGLQKKRSARQVKLDAVRTARTIKRLKTSAKVFKLATPPSRTRKTAKDTHA